MNADAWLVLLRTPGIGPVTGAELLSRYDSPDALIGAGPRSWQQAGLAEESRAWLAAPDRALINGDLDWLAQPGNHLIPLSDPRYPQRLRQIPDPPLALFVTGDPEVLATAQLAIVGSRNPTPAGSDNAHAFAAALAARGLVVASGLALGIDGAAHEGALQAGLTLAVCGTGLDRVYPARHRDLARRIAAQGALVSEFPPGTPPLRENFPRRNRLISGLSLGVMVVEAALQSGSLITARLAAAQGREVFAIPGSIHNPLARGCHRLIREGAKLVESADDVLEEIAPLLPLAASSAPATGAATAEPPDPDYTRLLDALGHEPARVDTLVERTGLAAEAVASMLLILELSGQVAIAPGGAYMRVR